MSKKLPKATSATLDRIRGEAAPAAVEAVAPPAALPPGDPALRRAQAREVVERHTAYAAVGGLIPVPFLDTLGVMATIALMIQAVAKIYGQPLHRDTARTLAASAAGGLGQAGAGAATAAILARLTPGANVFGIMASAAAAAALTRTIGRAFILHFETGGTALSFDADAIAAYFATSSDSQPTSRQ